MTENSTEVNEVKKKMTITTTTTTGGGDEGEEATPIINSHEGGLNDLELPCE